MLIYSKSSFDSGTIYKVAIGKGELENPDTEGVRGFFVSKIDDSAVTNIPEYNVFSNDTCLNLCFRC